MSRTDVRKYVTTYTLDKAADGLFYVALGWLATQASGPVGAAAIIAAGSIPRVLMLLFGGAIGDRLGLAFTLRLTLTVRVLLLLVFGALSLSEEPPGVLLALVVALIGVADALHMPAVEGLSGVILRGRGTVRLQGALSGIGNGIEAVAAPVAGGLIAWRADAVGWVGAALLLGALVTVPRLRHDVVPDAQPGEPAGSMVAQAWEGLSGVARDPEQRVMLSVFAIANLAATPAIVVGVPFLARERGWSAAGYGWVAGLFSAGSIIGGLALARWGERLRRPVRWSLLTMVPGALALAVLAISRPVLLAALAATLAGFTFTFGAAALMGQIKASTPPQRMGRTMALVQTAVYSLIPLGLVLFGALSEAMSAQTAELVAAAVMGTTGVLFLGSRAAQVTAGAALPSHGQGLAASESAPRGRTST